MKNLWVVIASLPPIIMFTFSAFAIGAHLATPSTPPPSLSVYVTALASLTFLLMLLPIIRRRALRRAEDRAVLAARCQINSP